MLQARVDVFDAYLTDDIREDCWSEEFIPPVVGFRVSGPGFKLDKPLRVLRFRVILGFGG
jgi:hypothetical protein